MLRARLKEILIEKDVSNYRLWKDLGTNQGQLSCFFNGKKGISLEKLERIADHVDCEIVLVSKEEIKRGQPNKKKVSVKEATRIAQREIQGSVEKFESMCPGFFVKAIDGPPVKLLLREGEIGVVSTKGQNQIEKKEEKPIKYRPWPLDRNPI